MKVKMSFLVIALMLFGLLGGCAMPPIAHQEEISMVQPMNVQQLKETFTGKSFNNKQLTGQYAGKTSTYNYQENGNLVIETPIGDFNRKYYFKGDTLCITRDLGGDECLQVRFFNGKLYGSKTGEIYKPEKIWTP